MKWLVMALMVVALYKPTPLECSQAPQIELSAIAQIESSGNPKAVGDSGKGLGLFQLHPEVIAEFNKANGCLKAHSDALDAITATQVADWYLHRRIPQILRWLKKPVTEENVIRCYNAGCGSLKRPPSTITQRYLAKYRSLAHAKTARKTSNSRRLPQPVGGTKVEYGGLLRGVQRSGGSVRSGACS